MFRRSRFSVRPNVSTAGRAAAAAPLEAPSANQEASETTRDASQGNSAAAVTDNKPDVTLSEKAPAPEDGNDQNGDGTSSSTAVQRRKRFSVKPKVAPGRPSIVSRAQKSPVKAVSETPVEVPASGLEKPTTSSQTRTTAAPQGLQSPRRRRPSEESKQSKTQPKSTPVSSDSSGPLTVSPADDSRQQTHLPTDSSKQSQSTSGSQVKEVPHRPAEKVPPFLPDKEAIEISEKARTLVSSKNVPSLTPSAFSLSKLLNDPSDLQKLVKAQRLRELLREERRKEKILKKAKTRQKEYNLDPAKMTMRDLIHYLPLSNPMTSSLEDSIQENEMVVPPSPAREESPERTQEPEGPPNMVSSRQEEEAATAAPEEEQDEAVMVPQVKVAEDGSLIIDEESLTVEVQRAKGPNPALTRDPIFERGSTTTYSSFRKGNYAKPWSSEETDMFFLAVSMVGTDFSMICQLFPHRARSEIKNKFKKEERLNSWRIDKAFRERRNLDIEYFSKLLEKILEVQKNRKKLKSIAEKNSPRKHKRKAKVKKSARALSDVEEENEEDENEVPDLEEEEEGEKENEELCNEGGIPVSEPKRKCKRKKRTDALTEEPNDNKSKSGEAGVPEDAEAALPEDHTNSDMSEKTQDVNTAKDTAVKPTKLSRGRAPKPLLPLGRKWGKKPPPPTKDTTSDKEDESVSDGASKEQGNKDGSPSSQANKRKSASDDISSEEEDPTVNPPKPTRYGRVPKPTRPLTYPTKEDTHSSSSETAPASPASAAKPKPKCTAKRGRSSQPQRAQKSKKPKLVTLSAAHSDFSDEEGEQQYGDQEVEEQLACGSRDDISASVFVPASLHTPQPVISEVDETIVELDILASMPDVLDISHDALCPDSSCEQAHHEAGSVEPCEHQLDLLVDVIEFLSSENTEVSEDESYNEAAQTLLTIGNLAHISQSAQNQIAVQDHVTGTTSAGVSETSHIEEEISSEPAEQEESATPSVSAAFGQGVPETSETVASVELQSSITDGSDSPFKKTNDEMCGQNTVCDTDSTPQIQSHPESSNNHSPQTKKGRLSRVKPKPNLGRTSRDAQPKSQPDTSTVRTSEQSHSVAPNLSQANETLSAADETTPNLPDCDPALLKDNISCTEVKRTEEPSESEERFVESGSAMSDQNSSEIQSDCISESQFKSSTDQATKETKSKGEEPMSSIGTAETGFINPSRSDSVITEVEQGSCTDSAPVQYSGDKPPSCVSPAEDIPVNQKGGSEVTTTRQSRRSRLQKVKPKPNLSQTSRTTRSKPQITKEPLGKDPNPTPDLKFHNETIAEVESPPTCTPSPEKQSPSTGPASVLQPSTTEELSTSEEKEMCVELVDQVDFVAPPSDQSASDTPKYPETHVEPSQEQTTRDTGLTSEFTDENLTSSVGATESSCNLVVADSAVTESQVGQESTVDSAPVQEGSGHPAVFVTPVEDVPVSQKQGEVASTSQLRRSRLQKVKPNLPQTSRTSRSKDLQSTKDPDNTIAGVEVQTTCSTTPPEKPSQIQSTDSASISAPSLELESPLKSTEELPSTETEKADGCGVVSSPKGSDQRKRRFPKVKPKPNLGSFTRGTLKKLRSEDISKSSEHCHMDTSSNATSEQQFEDNNSSQTDLKDSNLSTAACCSVNKEFIPINSEPVGSKKLPESTNDQEASSDDIVITTSSVDENQSTLAGSVPENKTSKVSTVEMESRADKMSAYDPIEAGPAAQGICKLDMSTGVTVTQQINDPAAISDVQSSKEEVNLVLSTHASPMCSDRDASVQSSHHAPLELTGSSTASRKTPQCRRSRLIIKPKPTCSSRPPRPQQIHNTAPAEADSGSCSQGVDASVDHKPSSELRPDIQQPVGGVIDKLNNQDSSPNDAGSSLGCLAQVIDQQSEHDSPSNAQASLSFVTKVSPSQTAPTSSTEGIQSYPVFSETLSEQVLSDPDEPFFILSLTEIPVSSSGEVVDSAAEHLSYHPVTDASMQQPSSVCGESLGAAGDGSLPNVPVPMDLISVTDIGPASSTYMGSTMKTQGDPHETGSTTVQPPKLPETVGHNKTEITPSEQRRPATGRRAKLQVKPNTTKKKQTSKNLAAREAESAPTQTNTTQDSERPGPSVQPKAFDDIVIEPHKGSGCHEYILTGGEDPDTNSGTQTIQNIGTKTQNRKSRGLSETNNAGPSSNRPRGKSASKGPTNKSLCAARKRSLPEPEASMSCDVPSAPTLKQPPKETHSTSTTSPTQTEVDIKRTSDHRPNSSAPTPSTSQCTAEALAFQQSDCVESSSLEGEPTSVSQYFLSDIFTEVEGE